SNRPYQSARRNDSGRNPESFLFAGFFFRFLAMLSEAVGLTLFPGIMAFAAASDLLTMTIANRLSVLLMAGFAALAPLWRMTRVALITHLGAGAVVLVAAFVCFARGWSAAA